MDGHLGLMVGWPTTPLTALTSRTSVPGSSLNPYSAVLEPGALSAARARVLTGGEALVQPYRLRPITSDAIEECLEMKGALRGCPVSGVPPKLRASALCWAKAFPGRMEKFF